MSDWSKICPEDFQIFLEQILIHRNFCPVDWSPIGTPVRLIGVLSETAVWAFFITAASTSLISLIYHVFHGVLRLMMMTKGIPSWSKSSKRLWVRFWSRQGTPRHHFYLFLLPWCSRSVLSLRSSSSLSSTDTRLTDLSNWQTRCTSMPQKSALTISPFVNYLQKPNLPKQNTCRRDYIDMK